MQTIHDTDSQNPAAYRYKKHLRWTGALHVNYLTLHESVSNVTIQTPTGDHTQLHRKHPETLLHRLLEETVIWASYIVEPAALLGGACIETLARAQNHRSTWSAPKSG